jgi:putative holliday junction resolvase
MPTLSIDFGDKRVGLAMADPSGQFVSPHDVLANDAQLLERLLKLIQAEDIERVVVGLPLHMDGKASDQTRKTIEFGKRLRSQTKAKVIFVDERLSSFTAEQELVDQKRAGRKMTRQMKKERLDAIAAAAFLRAYLSGEAQEIVVE